VPTIRSGAQETIGADDPLAAACPLDHQQVIADRVPAVLVATQKTGDRIGHRRHFTEEHVIAQGLRLADLALGARQAGLQRAQPAEHRRGRVEWVLRAEIAGPAARGEPDD